MAAIFIQSVISTYYFQYPSGEPVYFFVNVQTIFQIVGGICMPIAVSRVP